MARQPRRLAEHAPPGRIRLSDRELQGHLRDLERQLATLLPSRSIQLVRRDLLNSNEAYSVQKDGSTVEVESGRGKEYVVELADRDENVLHMGITEEWHSGRNTNLFIEIRLRFYVSKIDAIKGPPTLRLEWVGLEEAEGAVFPGTGAGHPHWHYGSDIEEADPSRAEALATELAADFVEEELGDISQTQKQIEAPLKVMPIKKFHLPAAVRWAAVEWDDLADPHGVQSHAAAPNNPEELIRWAVSAVKYMMSEMRKYG